VPAENADTTGRAAASGLMVRAESAGAAKSAAAVKVRQKMSHAQHHRVAFEKLSMHSVVSEAVLGGWKGSRLKRTAGCGLKVQTQQAVQQQSR
jgi:hypothetical protein